MHRCCCISYVHSCVCMPAHMHMFLSVFVFYVYMFVVMYVMFLFLFFSFLEKIFTIIKASNEEEKHKVSVCVY